MGFFEVMANMPVRGRQDSQGFLVVDHRAIHASVSYPCFRILRDVTWKRDVIASVQAIPPGNRKLEQVDVFTDAHNFLAGSVLDQLRRKRFLRSPDPLTMNLVRAALKREAIALAGSEKVDHYRVRVALNAREIEGLVSLFPSSVESEAAHRAYFVLKVYLGFDFENLSLFF